MINIVHYTVPIKETESFSVLIDDHPALYPHLHQHPEIQITLIKKGTGVLLAGDYVGPFQAGDVFVIGPDQPHIFRITDHTIETGATAISVFFSEKNFGTRFINLPEMRMAKIFIENCEGGFKIFGEAKKHITHNIEGLLKAQNIKRMVFFLDILNWLADLKDKKPLSNSHFQKPINQYDNKRISRVVDFTVKNSCENITVSEIAKIAGMTPEAFCKYFKSRTHKTYIRFLNEIRIHNACKLLMQGGPTVATVSHLVGFNSLSNFNRMFKKIMGVTPVNYVYQSVGLQKGDLL